MFSPRRTWKRDQRGGERGEGGRVAEEVRESKKVQQGKGQKNQENFQNNFYISLEYIHEQTGHSLPNTDLLDFETNTQDSALAPHFEKYYCTCHSLGFVLRAPCDRATYRLVVQPTSKSDGDPVYT